MRGDGMSLSCHTHPCPRPRKREGQKARRDSQSGTKTGGERPEALGRGGHREARLRGNQRKSEGRAEPSGAIPSQTVATAVETAWGRERGARDQQSQDRESYPRDPRAGTRAGQTQGGWWGGEGGEEEVRRSERRQQSRTHGRWRLKERRGVRETASVRESCGLRRGGRRGRASQRGP